jgi:hypothetical protein
VFDGVFGTGKASHGIWVDSAATADGDGAIQVETNGSNLIFRHIEANNAPALNSNGSRVFDTKSALSSSNVTLQFMYLHGGRAWVSLNSFSAPANMLIENSYFANSGSGDPALHSAGFTLANANNVTLRYSVIENMLGGSNTTYIEPQFNANQVYVYGNVFWGTSSNESTGQGIFAVTSTDHCTNCFIYNNTIVGLHTFSGIWCGNTSGQSITVDNNVWQGNPATPNLVGQGGAVCTDGGHNVMNTGGVSFVNQALGDFHLAAPTSAGGTLSSLFTLDPDGKTRGADGTWDRGAYEF